MADLPFGAPWRRPKIRRNLCVFISATLTIFDGGKIRMAEKHVSIEDLVVAPCQDACPAGIDVPRYIRAVKDGRYDEAVAVIREKIPFPVVCAAACFAPCEDICAYRQFGDPIAI